MTSTKHKKDQTSSPNWLMLKNLNLEESQKHLIMLLQSWQELRMIIQDLWLKHKLFKEILMDNLLKNPTCKEMLKQKMEETENYNPNFLKEKLKTEI